MGDKNNRLLTNMISYAALQIVNMMVGLFLPRLYLSVYGSEINGVVSTVNSFISYFSYLEAGLGLTMIHSLFKPLADRDYSQLNSLLSYSKKKYKEISIVYFVLVLFASFFFPIVNPTAALGKVEFFGLVLVIGLYGALDFYTMAKYRVLLTADRKEYVISNAMIVAQLLRFVFVWGLLHLNLSVAVVKIVPVLTLLLRSVILNWYIRRNYSNVDYKVPPCYTVEGKQQQYDALLLQISISTSISLPTIIISQFLGFKEANVYAVYYLVISAMISIISALSSSVSPMLGRSIAQGEKISGTYNVYDYIVSYVITVSFATTTVMILPFIKLYTNVVDDINYIYSSYALLISIWAAAYSYRIPVTAVLNAAAIYTKNRISNIVNLAIQIILGIIGTMFYGISGLLIVMIVAAIQRNISLSINNDREVLHCGIKNTIIRQILMISMIVFSHIIATDYIYSKNLSVMGWCVAGVIVLFVEVMICSLIWISSDPVAFKKCKDIICIRLAKI